MEPKEQHHPNCISRYQSAHSKKAETRNGFKINSKRIDWFTVSFTREDDKNKCVKLNGVTPRVRLSLAANGNDTIEQKPQNQTPLFYVCVST